MKPETRKFLEESLPLDTLICLPQIYKNETELQYFQRIIIILNPKELLN